MEPIIGNSARDLLNIPSQNGQKNPNQPECEPFLQCKPTSPTTAAIKFDIDAEFGYIEKPRKARRYALFLTGNNTLTPRKMHVILRTLQNACENGEESLTASEQQKWAILAQVDLQYAKNLVFKQRRYTSVGFNASNKRLNCLYNLFFLLVVLF